MAHSGVDMIAALTRLKWADLLQGDNRLAIASTALIERAKTLPDDDPVGKDALRLVGAICSMILQPENWNQPYGPMMSFSDGRTMIPDDLGAEELIVVHWLAENCTDDELRARCCDLAWLRADPRRDAIEYTKSALALWTGRPPVEDEWYGEGENTWRRATSVATRLRQADALDTIETRLFEAAHAASSPVYLGRMLRVVRDFALGQDRAADAIALLTTAAQVCSDGFLKRELLTDQSRWEHARKDEQAAWALVQQVAESWIAEAELRSTGENASSIAASSFLEDALQELRRIPRRYRSDEAMRLIAELPRRIREAGETSLEEMHEFVTEPFDLSEAVEQVRTRLAGRPLLKALASFVSLSPFASHSKERALAEDTLKGTIIGLLGGSTYAHDGRKIYSSSPDETRPDGIAANVWQRMMTHYEFRIQLVAVGQIEPGLQLLANEHQPSRADLLTIVRESGIVPPDDAYLFALGLHHGFYGEYAVALHLLVPRIESIVRYHLRAAGVDTSRIDHDSTDMEVGLSALMNNPEAEQIFGEDLAYELRALLCGPLGPNLRNRVAHGLFSAAEAEGTHGLYLWWFALKLVYTQYFNRLHANDSPASGEPDEAEPDPTNSDTALPAL